MAAGKQGLLKRAAFLLAAFALLGLAGSLMLEPSEPRPRREALEFPRYPRQEEIERQRRRSTFVLPRPPQSPGTAGATVPAEPPSESNSSLALDPLHVALAGRDFGVVLEAAALKDSPLGRLLINCLSPEMSAELAALEQKLGVRPLEQIERIALAGSSADEPVLILAGQLGGFDPSGLDESLEFEPQGSRSLIAGDADRAIASWDGQLLLVGEPEGVRSMLARLDGDPAPEAARLAGEAYGEVYGTLSWQAASQLLPRDLSERFARSAQRVSLHLDARDDLLLVADVYGDEPGPLRDLASAAGGALALGRLHAVRSEQPLLADLLDESRVIPGDGSFQVEMALPLATIAGQLGECAGVSARAPDAPTP